MKANNHRVFCGMCIAALLVLLVLAFPVHVFAHTTTPPPAPDPQPAPTDPGMTGGAPTTDTGTNAEMPADTTGTQPMDTTQTMEGDTSTYWLGYLFLGLILLVLALALMEAGRLVFARA